MFIAQDRVKLMPVYKPLNQVILPRSICHLPYNNDGFITSSVSDLETIKRIRLTYEQTGYIFDPHTAVGLVAGLGKENKLPFVTLATAHPAKFPSLLLKALPDVRVSHPTIELWRFAK